MLLIKIWMITVLLIIEKLQMYSICRLRVINIKNLALNGPKCERKEPFRISLFGSKCLYQWKKCDLQGTCCGYFICCVVTFVKVSIIYLQQKIYFNLSSKMLTTIMKCDLNYILHVSWSDSWQTSSQKTGQSLNSGSRLWQVFDPQYWFMEVRCYFYLSIFG